MKNRSSIKVMLGLVGMVKPLLPIMLVAITMGCIGNLMATFITVLGGYGIGIISGAINGKLGTIVALIIIFAVLRGILRYTEQASNHFIAFKLLARIRHLVFASLRKLAPAKLDGANKGNLISIITSDIELLEVFYAHTISPIVIAFATSLVMSLYIGHFDASLGFIAAGFYIIVGVIIPIINSKLGTKDGQIYRKLYGDLNTNVLDNLYGLTEILQFQQEEKRMDRMNEFSSKLEETNSKLKSKEAAQKISTDIVIMLAGFTMFLAGNNALANGRLNSVQLLICVIAMLSSFGPTAALSNLSNNLNQTLASGNRVLNLLEEKPILEDITEGKDFSEGEISFENIEFTYPDSTNGIKLESLKWEPKKIYGILGKSGCGKSTLLKLMMRFYETDKGSVKYNGVNVNEIKTSTLRDNISYVTQETFLFSDTIENNVKVAKLDATREEVIEACKKASIHDFIMSLPKGYDTRLAELGDSVSGGERQRIGVARAFLHNANLILLDEPTSNIDSLNEGIILEALKREKEDKTIVLVSHRKSTMGIVDEMMNM